MNRFKVTQKTELLSYLLSHLEGYKRNTIKELLKFRAVLVNGRPVTQFNHSLVSGDTVEIKKAKKTSLKADLFEPVYEDKDIIVIEKPAGWLTIATDKVRERTLYYQLNEYLKHSSPSRHQQLFIVHRLDKEVSGLLVFAKTPEAKAYLQSHWRDASKHYCALVHGKPKESQGEIGSYLSESKFLKVYSGPKTPESRFALTKYRTIKTTGEFSLLEVVLDTGRKHQIRVHLSDLGHPIVGDDKYGSTAKMPKRSADDPRSIALHAFYLKLPHPATGKMMEFKSPMPKSFSIFLRAR